MAEMTWIQLNGSPKHIKEYYAERPDKPLYYYGTDYSEYNQYRSNYKSYGFRSIKTIRYRLHKYFTLFFGTLREDLNVSYPDYQPLIGFGSSTIKQNGKVYGPYGAFGQFQNPYTVSSENSFGYPTGNLLLNRINLSKRGITTKDSWIFGLEMKY